MKFAYPLICGLIGSGVASEFNAWCKIYKDLPNINDIFTGKQVNVPRGTDQLYALTSSMIAHARECQDNTKQIEHSLEYAMKMPPDFACVLLKGYQNIGEDFAKKLMNLPTYMKWLNTRGKLLNGIVK